MNKIERLKKLIAAHERIELPDEPWPLPKAGDVVRALVRYDVDPAGILYDGAEALRHAIVDCRVWKVERSVTGDYDFVYFSPIEALAVPFTHSKSPRIPDYVQEWGGMDLVKPGGWPYEYIPREAVKRLPFLAAVETMKAHLDRRAAWI